MVRIKEDKGSGKSNSSYHTPVMTGEVLRFLNPGPGKIIVDATLGGGGHAEAIIKYLLPGGKLIGIDCDSQAIDASQLRLTLFQEAFQPIKGNFYHLQSLLRQAGITKIDGSVFDLGVSSHQLDCSQRGFSYSEDVFLDMRMDEDLTETAFDILQQESAAELNRIFKEYGEEKWAGRIARFIEEYRRSKGPIKQSNQLVEIIKSAVPAAVRRRGGHPAKRIFQALRIAVNSELENLKSALEQSIEVLKPGGRLVIISYHSLEDRLVKNKFRDSSLECTCPPGFPVCKCEAEPRIKVLTSKPVFPSEEEIKDNPRSKSARLRAAEKL